MSIRLSTKSRKSFSKIYRERKGTYMCTTKTARPLSHSCLGLTIIMLYPKMHSNIMFIYEYIYLSLRIHLLNCTPVLQSLSSLISSGYKCTIDLFKTMSLPAASKVFTSAALTIPSFPGCNVITLPILHF